MYIYIHIIYIHVWQNPNTRTCKGHSIVRCQFYHALPEPRNIIQTFSSFTTHYPQRLAGEFAFGAAHSTEDDDIGLLVGLLETCGLLALCLLCAARKCYTRTVRGLRGRRCFGRAVLRASRVDESVWVLQLILRSFRGRRFVVRSKITFRTRV